MKSEAKEAIRSDSVWKRLKGTAIKVDSRAMKTEVRIALLVIMNLD